MKYLKLYENFDWNDWEEEEEPIEKWVEIPDGVTLKIGTSVRINPIGIFHLQGIRNGEPMNGIVIRLSEYNEYRYFVEWENGGRYYYNNEDLLYNSTLY